MENVGVRMSIIGQLNLLKKRLADPSTPGGEEGKIKDKIKHLEKELEKYPLPEEVVKAQKVLKKQEAKKAAEEKEEQSEEALEEAPKGEAVAVEPEAEVKEPEAVEAPVKGQNNGGNKNRNR